MKILTLRAVSADFGLVGFLHLRKRPTISGYYKSIKATMTPAEFIAKWQHSTLSEKAGAQAHFLDLCDMLGVEKPGDPDNYCFERGATRTGAGHGWADVWKRHFFGWENKGPGADLSKALKQLMTYALALDNPPLLVVCDRLLIQIHTHFTGAPSEVHTIRIEDIGEPVSLTGIMEPPMIGVLEPV